MTIAPLVAGAATIAQDLPVAGSYLVSVQALRGQMQSPTRQYQIDRVADVTADASLEARWTGGDVSRWREALPGGEGVLAAEAEDLDSVRASAATCYDEDGALAELAANALRLDHDPATLTPLGLLIEPARTNLVTNAVFAGVVAGVIGSGGALPTGMSIQTAAGLTNEVIGLYTEANIPYVRLRHHGNATGGQVNINFVPQVPSAGSIAASVGQTYTCSAALRKSGGSLTNVTGARLVVTPGIGGTYGTATTVDYDPAETNLAVARKSVTATLADVGTDGLRVRWRLLITNGAAIDITVDYALPQVELASSATSPIPAASGTFARAADDVGEDASDYLVSAEGVLVWEGRVSPITGTAVVALCGETSGDSIVVLADASTLVAKLYAGGVERASLSRTWTFGDYARLAVAWSAGSFRFVTTGQAVVTATPAAMPALSGEIRYGRDADGANHGRQRLRARTLLVTDDLDGAGLAALVAMS